MGAAPDEQRDYNSAGIIWQYVKKDIGDQENQTGCQDPPLLLTV
jgi:hypothetical protein